MDLHLRLREEGGLAEQIYAQLQERISADVLPAGTVLPSSRELAGGTGRYQDATGFTYLNQHFDTDHFVTEIQGEVCRPKN
ncbi:GntR family transcriptional regulator [Kribbella sp. NBC_01510]|uniref:hypothetical protein n=1 Tax=Kribbella sp. NBC_01510 TaxID=2903581 RepID=UPI003865A6B4